MNRPFLKIIVLFRALNTFYGLRRAKKEGRWVSQAPVGYCNKHDERGKKYIAINPAQAEIVKWAFEQLAKGLYPAEQVFKQAATMGLECKKNNFLNIIRNPVYCGRIAIPKYKEEDAHTVKGLHEAIISESLFNDVQGVLKGKSQAIVTKIHSPDLLPLRGFIRYSKCSRVLCGSASKGRLGYYHYYHCSSACGCRHRAEEVNEVFLQHMQQFVVKREYIDLLVQCIVELYNYDHQNRNDHLNLIKEIDGLKDTVRKARKLLLNEDIDGADFKIIKLECEAEIEILEVKLAEALAAKKSYVNIEPIVRKAIERLTKIDDIYYKSSPYDKRNLIGSMYLEKGSVRKVGG